MPDGGKHTGQMPAPTTTVPLAPWPFSFASLLASNAPPLCFSNRCTLHTRGPTDAFALRACISQRASQLRVLGVLVCRVYCIRAHESTPAWRCCFVCAGSLPRLTSLSHAPLPLEADGSVRVFLFVREACLARGALSHPPLFPEAGGSAARFSPAHGSVPISVCSAP